MTDENAPPTPEPAFERPRLLGITIVALAIAAVGSLLVMRYAELDLRRDLQAWQDRLNVIADTRAEAVGDWVNTHFTELEKLAANPSLQLYFSELMRAREEEASPAPAPEAAPEEETATETNADPLPQETFLRNLLTFTADRLSFAPVNIPMSAGIPADVSFISSNGLGVLDTQNRLVAATPYFTALNDSILASLERLPPNMRSLIDMHKNPEGAVEIGFVQPIFALQADPASAAPIGRLVGVKTLEKDVFTSLLSHPGVRGKSLELLLVRTDSGNVVYLSPTADAAPLGRQLSNEPDKLAEAAMVAAPGSFVEHTDYRGQPVLATGRAIAGTPWTLIAKIDRAEALAESNMRRQGMVALLIVLILFVAAALVAVWYIASSRRLGAASRHFKALAERTMAQERLLKLVTDNQPEALYILDDKGVYRFANRAAAEQAGAGEEHLSGKQATDVLGPARAASLLEASKQALFKKRLHNEEITTGEGDSARAIRRVVIPLAEIPIVALKKPTEGVLVVEQDVTEIVAEREKRARLHGELIELLVTMVDRRDPHAANHSQLVSKLGEEVGRLMNVDAPSRETLRLAGLLMNIGKIVVPEQLLTRSGPLDIQEKQIIRASLLTSTELLGKLSFEGPVAETIRQSQEHTDGSGPLGLAGEDILLTARILAAVNAFVGMISPRAYRTALSADNAAAMLLDQAGKQFDRKVVIALINFMENRDGKTFLEECLRQSANDPRLAVNR